MPITAFQNKSALLFVPNQGQTNEKARFIARVNGHQFYFTQNSIAAVTYARAEGDKTNDKDALLRDPLHKRTSASDTPLRGAALFLTFEGAAKVEPQGQKQNAGRFHYFTGNDPINWRTQIPGYEQLLYANLYNGVDLTLAGSDGGLKFLWSLKEARNVGAIRIRYEGAEELRLNAAGGLIVRHSLGEMVDPAPVAWQEIGGEKKQVACAYTLEGNTVSFALTGTYDANAPLTIDPILPYSTYLGGSSFDYGYAIAVDDAGFVYVGGRTRSGNFPTTPGAFQTTFSGTIAAFVSKFAPDGKSLVYSTYIGGNGYAYCNSITIDALGCAYITGVTTSTDYPTTPGAFQAALNGEQDALVTKLSSNGASLVYSTYLGGSYLEYGYGIAVDNQGFAYVSGATFSDNFPVTPGAFQIIRKGSRDAFVSKLSRDGTSLVYSTLFGGTQSTEANAIALDKQGYAYITGYVTSADLPVTPGVFQPVFGGVYDAFVTKFSMDGTSLVYSSYLGGSDFDNGFAIAVDDAGCAAVAGATASTDFPVTPGTFQTAAGGIYDAFVTKVAPDGNSLHASTYLGGRSFENVFGAALDFRGNVYLTGFTTSDNFPITPQVAPSFYYGSCDSFVSIFSPALEHLLVSYYLGGSDLDQGHGIALGSDGAVYTTGFTISTDFPVTPGAFQTVFAGQEDAYFTKSGFALLKKASISLQGMP